MKIGDSVLVQLVPANMDPTALAEDSRAVSEDPHAQRSWRKDSAPLNISVDWTTEDISHALMF